MPRSGQNVKKGSMRTHSSSHFHRNTYIYLLIGGFLLLYGTFLLIRAISASLIVQAPDRLNIVVYDEYPVFYSFGINEVGTYALTFYPDLRVQVPGGYSYYRIGALGKLASLEKDPDLFKRTFAAVTSSYVDYYFFEDNEEVYYGEFIENDPPKRSNHNLFFLSSNAAFFDKLYIAMLLNRARNTEIATIQYLPFEEVKDDTVFLSENFLDKYIGLFYEKTYRNDNKTVQILYTKSYSTAEQVASILNGIGIVASDVSRERSIREKCLVIEDQENGYSESAKAISDYFECDLEAGETGFYDIKLYLGDLETRWLVE